MINKKLFIIKKLRNHKIKILFIIKPILKKLLEKDWRFQRKITNTKLPTQNPILKTVLEPPTTILLVVFRFFAFFPREIKASVRSLNKVCKLTDQCFCLPRFSTRFMHQYGVFGCKLQM